MTVSFKVAEQPSELKVHTSGLKYYCSGFFTLIAAMYLTIIMNRSLNKQIYRLYFNFICKFNFQVFITGNYASNLWQTLHACTSETMLCLLQ